MFHSGCHCFAWFWLPPFSQHFARCTGGRTGRVRMAIGHPQISCRLHREIQNSKSVNISMLERFWSDDIKNNPLVIEQFAFENGTSSSLIRPFQRVIFYCYLYVNLPEGNLLHPPKPPQSRRWMLSVKPWDEPHGGFHKWYTPWRMVCDGKSH